MEYFFYCRDRPGTAALRAELVEAHWSFMDGYAARMIARGPTLTPDLMTATGSMHIVDLPDAQAAAVFAFEEPNFQAGVYDDVLVRRWRNTLGATMWEFAGDPAIDRRFLVMGHGRAGLTAIPEDLRALRDRYLVDRGYRVHLIADGPMLSDDGTQWVGSATLLELPDRAAVQAMLHDDPYVRAACYSEIAIHDWQFGGRR
jgi:uncharacterized protein YciI